VAKQLQVTDAGSEVDIRDFSLSAGRLCLDFANSLDDRLTPSPREWLRSYAHLLAWAGQAGLVTDRQAGRLGDEAARRPEAAAEVLARAVTLREAIYRTFLALADQPFAAADLDTLNAELAVGMGRARVAPAEGGFVWGWADDESALDRLLWPIARSAAELLTGDELDQVRVCGAGDCNWLFMDTSRNRSRRWCEMSTCGNRAKARRYQQRKRQASV
jgi:predicted RNA-binding Zn ribbon-like protein